MSEVTIFGLGLMGLAIAKAYQREGVPLTVWNRTIKKAEALEAENVAVAQSISDAIVASPVSIICVDDPNSVLTLFGQSQVEPLLDGRTIIQLSTCLPKQVRKDQSWLVGRNADLLYGAIHCGPQHLGTKDGNILISGPSSTYKPVESLIGHRAGRSTISETTSPPRPRLTWHGCRPVSVSSWECCTLQTFANRRASSFKNSLRCFLMMHAFSIMLERSEMALTIKERPRFRLAGIAGTVEAASF